jgi:excisionase family DNA binding protein
MIAMQTKWITVSQAAELVGCTTQHLRKLAQDEAIASEKVGAIWLIDRVAAEKMAKSKPPVGRPRKNQKSS